jgi:hypothetical protein
MCLASCVSRLASRVSHFAYFWFQGIPDLRTIFMKSDNLMGGAYFAELLKLASRRVAGLNKTSTAKSSVKRHRTKEYMEPRLSIYGRDPGEWDKLARWVIVQGLVPVPPGYFDQHSASASADADGIRPAPGSEESDMEHQHVRWMVQIPRLFGVFCGSTHVKSFQDLLSNVFEPLFQATLHPDKHPHIDLFLQVCTHR